MPCVLNFCHFLSFIDFISSISKPSFVRISPSACPLRCPPRAVYAHCCPVSVLTGSTLTPACWRSLTTKSSMMWPISKMRKTGAGGSFWGYPRREYCSAALQGLPILLAPMYARRSLEVFEEVPRSIILIKSMLKLSLVRETWCAA